MLRNYTRWVMTGDGLLRADILATGPDIRVDPGRPAVYLDGHEWSPDEARLIGVRLIEGAALADGKRAIRDGARADTESGQSSRPTTQPNTH